MKTHQDKLDRLVAQLRKAVIRQESHRRCSGRAYGRGRTARRA